jgi:hypothetical protein
VITVELVTKRAKAEPFLFLDLSDPLRTRMIDKRDGSVWPANDTGFRKR